jgi:GntR family transcriptional regulator/MocR family aminotransferase
MATLRAAIARHVQAFRGIECGPDNLFLTSGNTDALQMIVRALQDGGGARAQVWVEDPGHLAGRRTLEREGLQVVPVPVDAQGLDVDAGERLAPEARFALITPSRQFPLGMPLALPRRLALIDWAREHGGVLIEDDYDSEVRFSGHPIPSLLSLAGGAQALAIGSLSKLTFPGLRLGYIVGAEPLVRRLRERRALEGAPIATTAQPALAEFISSGAFARHIRALRAQVTERRRLLIALLQRHLSHRLTVLPQEVGMHLTVTLKSEGGGGDVELAARGAALGLHLDPLSSHAALAAVRPGFLLGYAGWDEAELATGVERLCELLA